MKAQDKQTLHYRLGKEQQRIIEDDVIPRTDRFDSETDFTRTAVKKHASELRAMAAGGNIAKRLTDYLNEIRGITAEIQDRSAKGFLLENESAGLNTSLLLEPKYFKQIKELEKETTLTKSQATRYCVIRELSQLVRKTDVIAEGQEALIVNSWMELKMVLARPRFDLYTILAEYFVEELQATEYLIHQDSTAFEGFAKTYQEKFFETDAYEYLLNQYGESVFVNVENTIEEHTKIKLKPGLEKLVEEIEP